MYLWWGFSVLRVVSEWQLWCLWLLLNFCYNCACEDHKVWGPTSRLQSSEGTGEGLTKLLLIPWELGRSPWFAEGGLRSEAWDCYAYICIGLTFLSSFSFLSLAHDEPQSRVKVGITPPLHTLVSGILRAIGAQLPYSYLYSLLTYSLPSLTHFSGPIWLSSVLFWANYQSCFPLMYEYCISSIGQTFSSALKYSSTSLVERSLSPNKLSDST